MAGRKRAVTLVDMLQEKRAELRPSTDTALASYLGVNQSTANRWLRGTPPSLDRAELLAERLGRPVEEIERLILDARRRPSLEERVTALEAEFAELREIVLEAIQRRAR
jgi:transcriptional regulator with XRE-family HTH domain